MTVSPRMFEYSGSGTSWTNITGPSHGSAFDFESYMGGLYAASGAGYVEMAYDEAELEMNISATYEEVNSYNIVYTIDVTNNGPNDATNVLFTATLPDDSSFVSATGTGWNCGAMGQNVTCFMPTLADSAATQITLIVHVENEGTYELIASVNSDTSDYTQANNNETLRIEITQLAETGESLMLPMVLGSLLLGTLLIIKRKSLY